MSLVPTQARFSVMLAKLLIYADSLGYKCALGRGYVDAETNARQGGHPSSNHLRKLAQDIDLFDADGNYLTKTKDHEPLGLYWEAMGGAWGGRFSKPDGNHYSLEYRGIK